MDRRNLNIAVVEDNGAARINLRNHLIEMGFSDIGCYSQGRELRGALRQKRIDIILMDFHLGLNKNGVEVIQDLLKEGFIKHTTSLIFVTSDRLPMIIGQIVDIHPDAVVLKPYTIRNLERTLSTVIKLHSHIAPALKLMDEENYQEALKTLEQIIIEDALPKQKSALIKLKARLHTRLQQFDKAIDIYQSVLKSSDKVIWAKWGLIQNTHLSGDLEQSKSMLQEMLKNHLTNDKACEWLARIFISEQGYEQAEQFLDKIKEGDLSIPAARLKAYLYQIQEKMDEAIKLIEKKRDANRSIRERFSELSFDLARLYLTLAEQSLPNERKQQLQTVRHLIGSAARKNGDDDLIIKRNYMDAHAAILENDIDRAKTLLDQDNMLDLENSDIPTLANASAAWFGIGDKQKASEILALMDDKIQHLPDENEKTVSHLMLVKEEKQQGNKKTRALEFNKQGMDFYIKNEFQPAIELFYFAYQLYPTEAAFILNLLQAMVEAKCKQFKSARVLKLLQELKGKPIPAANITRMKEIKRKVEKNRDVFVVETAPIPEQAIDKLI